MSRLAPLSFASLSALKNSIVEPLWKLILQDLKEWKDDAEDFADFFHEKCTQYKDEDHIAMLTSANIGLLNGMSDYDLNRLYKVYNRDEPGARSRQQLIDSLTVDLQNIYYHRFIDV